MAAGAGPKTKGGHAKRETATPLAPAGLAAREAAVRLIAAVMHKRHSLDDALAKEFASDALAPRDRALARLIAGTVLRHAGELKALLTSYLEKPPPEPSGKLWPILLAGAAQLVFLETPPHAAVGLAVEQARLDPRAKRYDRLVNAVLRRVSREGTAALQDRDAARQNIPAWLFDRWRKTYGEAEARRIALASLCEAPLDVSVKSDPELWAERLGGTALPTGSVRLAAGGRIEDLTGYAEGAWWVQDAAAAIPATLFGPIAGKRVLDLCAAPGGKTAQLAAAGGNVVAVDRSPRRLQRLKSNLARLHLEAECVVADATTWHPRERAPFVLLDAPCTATGAIRRHPDVPHLKTTDDVARLAAVQERLLDAAVAMLTPGGTLVFCTCSLQPEEGPHQVERLLARNTGIQRKPVAAAEIGGLAECLTPDGDLRTFPCHLAEIDGLDGFYAARLVRAQ